MAQQVATLIQILENALQEARTLQLRIGGEITNPLENSPLESWDLLSLRTLRVLEENGISDAHTLLGRSMTDLLNLPGFGKNHLEHIVRELTRRGLTLKVGNLRDKSGRKPITNVGSIKFMLDRRFNIKVE